MIVALGVALHGTWVITPSLASQPASVAPELPTAMQAQFRGCVTEGWCRFWIDSADPSRESIYPIRLDGVVQSRTDDALSRAVRDRLNALLSNMIHQHKRVELHGLRSLDDGTFAASVTVNGADVASDPILAELGMLGSAPQR
jgi:hypothetical protein